MSGLESSMIKARNAEKRGDFAEAERLYHAVLAKFPRNDRARKGLDAVFKNRALAQVRADGPPQAALDKLVETYNAGQLTQVITQAEGLLETYPRAQFVHNLLGAAWLSLGRHGEAETALRDAYSRGVRIAPICNNLGMAIAEQGRHEEALRFYREAIEADPDHAIARNNLGNSLKKCGQTLEALRAYGEAVAIQPDYADALNNMGLALELLGRTEDAKAAYARVLDLNPNHAAAHNNLGNLHTGAGHLSAAVASYERALAIQPAYPEALYNLGNVFKRQGRVADANLAYERAKAARPGYADASAEQGKTLALEGRLEEAIAAFDEALAADPDHTGAKAHRIYYCAHMCDWSVVDAWQDLNPAQDNGFSPFAALPFEDEPARALQRSRAWAKKTFTQPAATFFVSAPNTDERIRIGYFSADFHDHATMHLMSGLLREHDRKRFGIHAFGYGPQLDDSVRQELKCHVDSFTDVGDMADAAIVHFVRSRGLDIAVDLKGYTQNTRLEPFAQRMAPVQIGYLGYPGSSGTDFIDYFIADPVAIPEAGRQHFSEQLILLPDSYQPNDSRRPIAASNDSRADWNLPADATVLCCFNHNYKISRDAFDIWMRVLAQVEGSVLWLLRSNRWAEANLRREAEARGIAGERLIFADHAPHSDHLARLRHADLFVDTFAVNAHTTASDALWAGVPLVTLAGRQFAARVGASLLHAVGLPELVTETARDYEALILDLARNPDRLATIRAKLAANRLTQPLFDTVRYTRHLEAAYSAVHQRRIEGEKPSLLVI